MKIKNENYITIQGWMRTVLNLSGNDLLVYAIIYQFSQDGDNKFTGSLQYLADWCGATKQGIVKNLKNLTNRGLIKSEHTTINGVNFVAYYTTELHTIQLSCTNNISISNTTNISNTNNTNKQNILLEDNIEEESKEEKRATKAKKFVDDYNRICKSLPKCERMTAKRSKGISNILKKFSEEEILTVFEKLEASDFCTGKNDSGWKANIDFILREDKFVSTLEGRYDNKKPASRRVEKMSAERIEVVSAEEKENMFKYGKKF